MDIQTKDSKMKEDTVDKDVSIGDNEDYLKSCINLQNENVSECSSLQYPCISCERSVNCIYGGFYNYTCKVKQKVLCSVSITTTVWN